MSEQVLQYRVDGMAELHRQLHALETDVAVKWVNGGVRAGARVVQMAALGNVPIRSGTLKGSVRLRRGKKVRADNVREYFVMAGNRKEGGGGAFYAHMVELGTKPHVIKGRIGEDGKRKKLYFGGNYHSSVMHPGSPAQHFMERALRTSVNAATDATANYIRAKLAKARLDPASETE